MTTDRAAEHTADAVMGQILAGMQPRIRAFLRNLLRAEVDDLVQETMARAWRSRQTFDRARGSADAWLMRIAFRAFLDRPQDKAGDDTPAAAPTAVANDDYLPRSRIRIRFSGCCGRSARATARASFLA